MKKLILFFGILCSYGLSAQVYVIDNGTVTTTCSGIFVDTGGNTAPYSSNESFTYTICPENPGQLVQLEFTDFDTLAGADIMTIFNADNATDPTTTLGEYSGNTFAESPGFISATSENPSGCLTIVFTSSPAAANNGWVANVTCFVPCQTILSQIDSAVPTPNADGYIRVCPNDEITLTGSGQFSTSDVGATYQWDLGDGTTQNGKTATFSYTTPGVYLVNLNISDTNASNDPSGCKNTNLLNQVIQVAFPTDFTGTAAESTVLCYGESMTITGIATPVPVLNQCTPPESQETFLPDGNGTSYETSIVVDCFNSDQTLDSIDQLVNICLEMEHSYLADLDISIVSPTGQTVKLHNSGTGGSANLGVPWATDEADSQSDVLTPGEGYQYCFLVDNTLPTLAGGVENGGVFIVGDGTDTYIDSFVPAGSYSSANPLSGLLGSSLNGSWTIKIKDNATKDNGYIFSWGLNFDTSIQPAALSFTPTITSEVWDADSTITNVTGNVITIQPTTAGTYCYTYRTTDDFGCNYFKDVCIDLTPEIIYVEPNDLFECSAGASTSNFDLTQNDAVMFATTADPTNFVLTYHTTQADADADINPISTADAAAFSGTDGQVIYCRFEYLTSNCYDTNSFTLNFSITPSINPANDLIACDEGVVDGIESFALIDQTPIILGAQLAADYRVTYHTSFVDADAGTNELPDNYNNSTSPEPIFVRIQGISASICSFVSATPVFNLIVNPLPVVPVITDFVLCDDPNSGNLQAFFDLDDKDLEIINGQNSTTNYYATQNDADNGVNQLTSPFENTSNPQTLYVALTDLTTNCRTTGRFTLVVNPLPQLVTPGVLEACDDVIADGLTSIDLSLKDDEIRGGNVSYSVRYYLNQLDADADVNPLVIPYTNISNPQTIIARGENINSGCYTTVPLELTVSQAPIVNTPTPLTICDVDSDGFGSFNLTDRDLEITGGNAGFIVSYHETLLEAENETNALSSPYDNIVINTQSVFARIENPAVSTLCASIEELVLIVHPTPQLVAPSSLEACDDDTDEFIQFDLTSKAPEFLAGIPVADVAISYYETLLDAENNTNPIGVPTNYTNLTNPQDIWILVVNNATGCEKITSLELIVNPLPLVTLPTTLTLCDDNTPGDEQEQFTLEDRNTQILNGQLGLDVSYYLTLIDAEANLNPLVSPYTNITNPQTVFVRVQNTITTCHNFTTLTLEVLPIPIPRAPNNLKTCDDTLSGDGQEIFDLTINELFILNGELGVTPSYYETLLDAENGINPILDPANYTNTDTPVQTIYVRVNNDIKGCFAIINFDVIVYPLPTATAAQDLLICEVGTDNLHPFDLEAQSASILGIQDAATHLVTYHETLADAATGINPLVSPYVNTTNPQTIYVNVTNTSIGCQNSSVQFNLEVLEAAVATSPNPFALCDDNIETDGDPTNDSVFFDLLSQNVDILNGQNPGNYLVRYYASQSDADLEINELPDVFENTVNPQIIIARVDNDTQVTNPSGSLVDSSVCYETAPVTLIVNPLPIVDTDDNYILCVDTNGTEVLGPLEIETGLSDLDYTFIWKNATGTTVETASRFSPTQGGVYTLEVFDATQPTKCAAPIKIFTVVESSPPEVTAVVTTEAFAKTHVIVATATGLGVYEYSLDQGPWQDTGVFSNVNPGEHVVNVRDLKGCGIGQAIVFVIDFPKYFTPNGDGYHDTWNIIGVSDQSNAIIQIFDRYGKFLKEIRPSGYGWNGTYNGALLPSSDYWFILKYNDLVTEEPKLLKAHFSLKR